MYERVLQPLGVGPIEVKNRIFLPGHGTQLARDGLITDDLTAYYRARAAGGVGLVILDSGSVHPSSTNSMIEVWDDRIVPGYASLSASLHRYDCRVFQQLWHGGGHFSGRGGTEPWGPSAFVSPFGGRRVSEMSVAQIEEVIGGYGAAARRAEEGGLDGVEVHAGHGYLIQQFLSPILNRRHDGYGGTLHQRMGFLREVLLAVRFQVSSSFVVGIRISDEATDGGLSADDCAQVVATMDTEGLIDFVNASQGSYFATATMLPSLAEPRGSMLPTSEVIIKGASAAARFVVGRIQDLDFAERLVAEDRADMVGFVRPLIADPELLAKSTSNRRSEVRPCIGCNQGCVGGIFGPAGRIGCTVNPAAGREVTLPAVDDDIPRASRSRSVVVVGGGVAGMSAARLAALRGHDVSLFEAGDSLGGTVRTAGLAPHLGDIALIADWLEAELVRLAVKTSCGRAMQAADIVAMHPDVVLVACGSMLPAEIRLVANPGTVIENGVGMPQLDIGTVLRGEAELVPSSSVLVYDDTGGYEAIAASEALLTLGHSVTFVTRMPSFSPRMTAIRRGGPALRRLDETGRFTLMVSARLEAVRAGACDVVFIEGGRTHAVEAAALLIAGFPTPNDPLSADLVRAGIEVKAIGDASQPRDVQSAMRESYHVALAL